MNQVKCRVTVVFETEIGEDMPDPATTALLTVVDFVRADLPTALSLRSIASEEVKE
jgi:hypothetical protein